MSTKTYTYEEAQKAALDYYEGDELAADVLISKYALKDSSGNVYETTPVDIQRRLAREFARIEKKYPNPMSEKEIFELFSDWTVCPQGGPMAGIGNQFQTQSLSNCFVIGSPCDSYGGIMRADEQLTQIMKRRGGCGVDISTLRPKGLATKNAAMTTDGIGLFMQRYSNTTREVAQEGRRGALMLSISVHHPDILTFANIKRNKNLVTGANVSIKFTDEFLEAVEKGEKYQQRWPVEKDVPHTVEKWVDAREVYTNIMSAARDCSEPGGFFWDTVLKMSPADCYADVGFKTISTNPCLTGDTLVAVADGRGSVPIKQLADEEVDVPVYAKDDLGDIVVKTMRHPRITGFNQPVYKVTIEGGHSFKATGNHKMIMVNGTERRVDELQAGEGLWVIYQQILKDKLTKKTSQSSEKIDAKTLFQTIKTASKQGYQVEIDETDNVVLVTRRCEECGKEFQVRYDQREISFCDESCAQKHANKKDDKTCINSILNKKIISIEFCGYEDVYNGTVDDHHNFYIVVDESLQGNHVRSTLLCSLNCGELPLSEADSCRLLFVNYTKFVKNPFTDKAQFDHERFATVVQKAQRLMDDLVDLELEAINTIIKKVESDPEPEDVKRVELNLWKSVYKTAENGRRTGLGITALGDLIAYMNLKYGSPESVKLTEEVYRALAVNSYKSSVQMAKERGAFPVYDYYKECNNPFIIRIMGACPELKHDYMRYGRRNIGNLTTAPVGSLSILTQTTSGCEPVLWLKARRKRKLSVTDKMGRVDEVDAQGDRWQHYNIYHPGVKAWMEVTGKTDETESPYFGSTIEDIDPFTKVDIQAAAQKWVDHSISNTLNMPKDVTTETVSELFMKAWKTGCKGMTVYRIGSREAVIVKEGGEEDKKKENAIVKRPKELPCDIHRSNIGGQQYVVLVGLFDGKPYEIFAGLQESIEIPKKAKRGILIKNGKDANGNTTYNLKIMIDEDDYMMIKDVVTQFDNPTYGAFTRTISYLLRLGAPIVDIVEQLRKDKNSNITSFSSCIARVLAKGYIKDGSSASGVCPSCGSKELRYIEACATCMSCGQSKCS